MPPTEETPGRALALALSAMAVVAVVVGLVVGGVFLAAARVTGVEESAVSSASSQERSLYLPSYRPTKSSDTPPVITPGKPSPTPTVELPTDEPSLVTPVSSIRLTVTPLDVSPGERISFSGVYPAGDGQTVQVQRNLGGTWTDFPVSATVQGSTFDTWIITGQTGRQRFRVYDAENDRASNAVTVTIG